MIGSEQVYMVFDYETFSECNLKKSGAYEYAVHPSTEVLCLAYCIGTLKELSKPKIHLLTPKDWEGKATDGDFVRALLNPKIKLVAHNAFFEKVITEHVLTRISNLIGTHTLKKVGIEETRWICTAASAASAGLPRSLDGASLALELAHKKDKKGHAVMLKLAKPKEATLSDPLTRHTDPVLYRRLYDYCVSDIAAEVELFLKLPRLHARENRFWQLNQAMNMRGFAVDRKLVKGALSAIKRETKAIDAEVNELTEGTVNSARQRDVFLEVLKLEGVKIKNLKAASIQKALLQPGLEPTARRLLELRVLASKSSTAKFKAFELRTRTDGRARDNTLFYGAHTGRDSGSGLQPQNLFKSTLAKKPEDLLPSAIELVRTRDLTAIQALFPNSMEVFASVIRSAIIAEPGKVLDVGDFATIEVRVLFWLANHTKGLKALAEGNDLYLEMAAVIYNCTIEEVTLAYEAGIDWAVKGRQLGKQVVLGAGFGIGVGGEKFQASAKQYGLIVSLALSQKSIRAYRKIHSPIPRFWEVIERAAIKAVENPGKSYTHGFLKWKMEGRWLTCELPIGRKLYYFQPRMEWETTKYGRALKLTYLGVDSVSRKFKRMSTWGGKLTENVVQAVARDLLYEALDRLDTQGHKSVLTIHDEIVTERDLWADGSFDTDFGLEMLSIMSVVPAWAKGMPIKVEGWSEERYRK